jgi:hypothetical protein
LRADERLSADLATAVQFLAKEPLGHHRAHYRWLALLKRDQYYGASNKSYCNFGFFGFSGLFHFCY